MSDTLTSENTPQRALVIGASRGIGLGLVRTLLEHGHQVTATLRDTSHPPEAMTELKTQYGQALELVEFDLAGPAQVDSLTPARPLDLLIISAGIMGPDHQRAEHITLEDTATLFNLNAMAPLRLARALLPSMSQRGVIAFMSSRMGSVSLNDSGDRELYRASKAALNSLTRGFAVNEALPAGVSVLNLHPGWVQTDMGGEDAPVTVEQSVTGLVAVLDAALGQPEHRFVDFEGKTLTW